MVIDTDPATLAAVVWEGRPLEAALHSGDLRIEGDRKAVKRFVRAFPLP